MHDDLLVAEGTSAKGMRQGPPLLCVCGGISDADDARLVQFVPLVLEEALFARLDVAVDVTIGLGGDKGQPVGTRSDDVTW